MTRSRDRILGDLRREHRQGDAPEPPGPFSSSGEGSWDRFEEELKGAGGRVVSVVDRSDLERCVQEHMEALAARRVCLMVDGVSGSNVDLNAMEDPRELDGLDLALVDGDFAVAENGAVWVTDRALAHRAVLFLAEHIGLVVESRDLVPDMHEACRRADWEEGQFGCFISGPSKTADIEQALVIGAHGPRSLTVFVVGM